MLPSRNNVQLVSDNIFDFWLILKLLLREESPSVGSGLGCMPMRTGRLVIQPSSYEEVQIGVDSLGRVDLEPVFDVEDAVQIGLPRQAVSCDLTKLTMLVEFEVQHRRYTVNMSLCVSVCRLTILGRRT